MEGHNKKNNKEEKTITEENEASYSRGLWLFLFGLKKTDTPVLTGHRVYHNNLGLHMALNGKTPAKCGIMIEGKDKWKTVTMDPPVVYDVNLKNKRRKLCKTQPIVEKKGNFRNITKWEAQNIVQGQCFSFNWELND